MIAYLIKSTVCLLLLLGVYHVFLEREKMHRFNRYFLMFSLMFSLIIPLISINIGIAPSFTDQISEINSRLSAKPPAATEYVPVPDIESQATQMASDSPINYTLLLIGLYGIIASILLIRLLRNLCLLFQKTHRNPGISLDEATLILVDDCDMPHSFFKFIFVDKHLYQSGQIREEVLNHELTHVRQFHSLDILFIELLKIVFWFNPVFWFYKRAMQLNHEFLADESVVAGSNNVQSYQKLLLKMQSGKNNLQLASSIHYSITKKRFIMMTKQSTRLRTLCKQLALIPLLAGLVFTISTQKATAQDVQSMSITELMEAVVTKIESVNSLTEDEKEKLNSLFLKMQNELGYQLPKPPILKAKTEEILKQLNEEYNKQIKNYNNIKPLDTNRDELERSYKKLINFYNEMDRLQSNINQKNPPPPPKPLNPAERMEEYSKNPTPPPNPLEKISERNLLNIWINREGLILMNEEPTPLKQVKAKVKAFITNNGAEPDLPESPQKATITIRTVRQTPYKVYTELINNVQHAYLEIRNITAQTEYGIDYEKLVENSPAKTKIREMYPVRISIADPEQAKHETKNQKRH